MEHVVHQPEIHVFVHVCFSQQVTSDARSKKVVRLYVNIVASVLFLFDHLLVEFFIRLLVFFYIHKLV